MKKILVLLLVLSTLFLLTACGKSAEVRSVEEQIAAIGKVTTDSEEAVLAAEAAYDALSEKDREKVENYAALTTARKELDAAKNAAARAAAREAEEQRVEALRQSFVGTWREETQRYGRDFDFTLSADGTCRVFGNTYPWTMSKDGAVIKLGDYGSYASLQVYEEDGFTKLLSRDGDRMVYVKDADHDAAFAQKYRVVTLTEENAAEYFRGPVSLGSHLDEWGEPIQGETVYLFRSTLYDEGWVYLKTLGMGEFALEFVYYYEYPDGREERPRTIGDPFVFHYGISADYLSPISGIPFGEGLIASYPGRVGRGKGEMLFVRQEYVAENRVNANGVRVVTLTSGEEFEDWMSGWNEVAADYEDYKY